MLIQKAILKKIKELVEGVNGLIIEKMVDRRKKQQILWFD